MKLDLTPPPGFTDAAPELYASHVEELESRFKRGASLEPATDAECLLLLATMRQRLPLTPRLESALSILFSRVIGYALDDSPPHPEAEHAISEFRKIASWRA